MTFEASGSTRKSRWSDERYTNPQIPSYIPPEMLLMNEGKLCKAFLMRCALLDCNRLIDSNSADEYFAHTVITPEYDRYGYRTNTPENLLQAKKRSIMEELSNMLKLHRELTAANGGGSGGTKEIVKKRYFTREEMELGAYGALLGARGSVHQELEKTTRCKIVLAGKGITDSKIDNSANAQLLAQEEPHARVTAPNEKALQAAMERIEWILSDDPEALAFRENNRKKMAKIDGRYNPDTWVTNTAPRGGAAAPTNSTYNASSSTNNRKRDRQENAPEVLDDDVKDFLEAF